MQNHQSGCSLLFLFLIFLGQCLHSHAMTILLGQLEEEWVSQNMAGTGEIKLAYYVLFMLRLYTVTSSLLSVSFENT